MDAAGKKKIGVALVVWVLVSFGLLLAPAPREWGAFGKWINSYYDQVRLVLQPAAHAFLMSVGVVLLMQCSAHRPLRWALLISIVTALLFAVGFEMLQSTLPSKFARQCDAEDLIPSMAGMCIGGMIGARQRLKNDDENK